MNRLAKYRTRLRRESTAFGPCELKFIWPTSAFAAMRCAQSSRRLARQFDTEARPGFCLDILIAPSTDTVPRRFGIARDPGSEFCSLGRTERALRLPFDGRIQPTGRTLPEPA